MTTIKAVDVSEIEKLIATKGFGVEHEGGDSDYVIISNDLRELLDRSPSVSGEAVTMLALNNTMLQKRISVLEDLLSSAYNIANRNGENTHWERFAGQLHVNGISPVTAKTFKILPSDTELSAYKPQADDVRKDAERYRWIRANPKLDICGTDEIAEFDAMIDRAIDKARE